MPKSTINGGKSMKKNLALLLVLMMALTALTGCGGGGGGDEVSVIKIGVLSR